MTLPGKRMETRVIGLEYSLWMCVLTACMATLRKLVFNRCDVSETNVDQVHSMGCCDDSDQVLYKYMHVLDMSTGLEWPTTIAICWVCVVVSCYVVILKSKQAVFECVIVCTLSVIISCVLFLLHEKHETHKLKSERMLADLDSRFLTVRDGGIVLHYKQCTLEPHKDEKCCIYPHRIVSMLHGFGANIYSYECNPILFHDLGSALDADCVVVHDTPGFGLTSRSHKLSDYSILANSMSLSELVNFIGVSGKTQVEQEKNIYNNNCNIVQKKQQRIIIAHSMGSLATVLMLSLGLGRADAVILIAPALWAYEKKSEPHTMSMPLRLIIAFFSAIIETVLYFVAWFVQPLMRIVLHQLVRRVGFWRTILQIMIFHESKYMVTQHRIDGYRRPRAVKNWDDGIVLILRSMVSWRGPAAAFSQNFSDARRSVSCISIACALRILVENGLPVLIIHGTEDKIVQCSNSCALKKMIPSLEFVQVVGVGHCVHEETPHEFVKIVAEFVHRVLHFEHS